MKRLLFPLLVLSFLFGPASTPSGADSDAEHAAFVATYIKSNGDVLPVLKLFRNTSFPDCRYRKVDKPASEGDGK